MLASVSPKLADHCTLNNRNGFYFLSVDYEVLQLFFQWMLRQSLRIDGQETMVRAWQFGRKWEIPAFQKEVMRCLVAELEHQHIDLRAMRRAYGATSPEEVEGDKLLREAFMAEFAFESRDRTWFEEDLSESGLNECIDFHKDYTSIMCVTYDYDDDYNPKTDGARISELLVSETME